MASAQEHGELRIMKQNAEGTQMTQIWRGYTHDFPVFNQAGTEYYKNWRRGDQPHMLASQITMRQDDKLILEFKAFATDIIESEESLIIIPCRFRDTSSGVISNKSLTGDVLIATGTTTFGQKDTTDITCTASVWTTVGYYKIPAQTELKFGNNVPSVGKMYVYLGDDST